MRGSIWRVPASGGTAEELTSGPGYDYQPSYSPDGQKVVFVRDREGQLDLWEYSSTEPQLRNDEAVDLLPSYGPAGEIVFYSSRAGNFDIWQYPLEPLTSGSPRDIQPSHSPTSPNVAFVSTRDSPLGTGGLWTLDLQTGQTSLVHWEETVYRARPVFSPDGNELLFSSDGDLWRIPVSGGVPIRVTKGPGQDIDRQWSPDGEHIVYISDARHMRIAPRDGGATTPIKISKYQFKRPTGLTQSQPGWAGAGFYSVRRWPKLYAFGGMASRHFRDGDSLLLCLRTIRDRASSRQSATPGQPRVRVCGG